MAKTTAAVLDEDLETEAEVSYKSTINEAIAKVVEVTGIDVQKNRYKAMRAIAYQAFANAIDAGEFDDLVDEAIQNIDLLPKGWEIDRSAKLEKAPAKASPKKAPAAKEAPAKKAAAKAPAKAAAAPKTARRRPVR